MTGKLSHLDQFKMKHDEILQHMRDISRLEVAAIVASGAIYAWLLVNKDKALVPAPAWFIAPIIIGLCGLKCLEISVRIRLIAKYLRCIETDAFGKEEKQDLPGYERYNYNLRGYDRMVLSIWGGMWVVVFGLSFWASWFFSRSA